MLEVRCIWCAGLSLLAWTHAACANASRPQLMESQSALAADVQVRASLLQTRRDVVHSDFAVAPAHGVPLQSAGWYALAQSARSAYVNQSHSEGNSSELEMLTNFSRLFRDAVWPFDDGPVLDNPLEKDPGKLVNHSWHYGWTSTWIWIIVVLQMLLIVQCIRSIEGTHLVYKIVPVAAAVSMCVLVNDYADKLGPPWSNFSPTTALITVVITMDMHTLERFVLKITLRGLGTVIGGLLAAIAAEVSSLAEHHIMVPTACVFAVFIGDAVLAKRFGYMSYSFTMTSVTFALVFFGYVRRGWVAVQDRILSVFIGEGIAIFCTLFFSMVNPHGGCSASTVAIISKSHEIFQKSLVAIDFAFIRNHIHSAPDDASALEVQQMLFQEEVGEWYRFGSGLTASELRELVKSTIFHDLPIDVSVSMLQTECRTLWSDMVYLRKVFPDMWCGYRVFRQLPAYCSLPERCHPLFVQASALAHAAMIDPIIWQSLGQKLDSARVHLQALDRPFAQIFQYKIQSVKSRSSVLEARKDEVLENIQEIANSLQWAQRDLDSVRAELLESPEDIPAGGLARFDGFCHGLNLVIVDFCSLAMTCLKLMEVPDEECEEAHEILTHCAGLDSEDIKAHNEFINITSSKLVNHWGRVQALLPQHGRPPIDEGAEGED